MSRYNKVFEAKPIGGRGGDQGMLEAEIERRYILGISWVIEKYGVGLRSRELGKVGTGLRITKRGLPYFGSMEKITLIEELGNLIQKAVEMVTLFISTTKLHHLTEEGGGYLSSSFNRRESQAHMFPPITNFQS